MHRFFWVRVILYTVLIYDWKKPGKLRFANYNCFGAQLASTKSLKNNLELGCNI